MSTPNKNRLKSNNNKKSCDTRQKLSRRNENEPISSVYLLFLGGVKGEKHRRDTDASSTQY